jgi:hypothetical protein
VIKNLVAGIALALLLSACNVVRPVDDPGWIRTVAVVSGVNDIMTMRYTGHWTGGREDVPVEWGLRDRMRERFTEALRERYEVRKLDRDVSAAVAEATLPTRDSNFTGPDDAVDRVVKTLAPGQVDAIVVIADRHGALYSYRVGGPDFPYYVGYMYDVYVYDGRTLERIGKESGSVYRNRLGFSSYDNAATDVDIGWRGEPYATLPDRKKDFLRRAVYDLIDRSAAFTLGRLHMLPAGG